jgi:hypothetical protein
VRTRKTVNGITLTKKIEEFNETHVREEIIGPLLRRLGYSAGMTAVESATRHFVMPNGVKGMQE